MSLRHRHKRRQAEARRVAEEVAQRLNPQPVSNMARNEQQILRTLRDRRANGDDFLDAQRHVYELLSKPKSKRKFLKAMTPRLVALRVAGADPGKIEYFASMYRRGVDAVNAGIDAAVELRRYRK